MIPSALEAMAQKSPPWPALRDELQLSSAGRNRDGSPAWHLTDPVRNLFFRLGWLEIEILKRWQMADAAVIADTIRQQTTLQPEEEDVSDFVAFLQQQQLLRTARYRPGETVWKRLLHSYLFVRIPLIHPDRMLRRLLPMVRVLFSQAFLLLTLVVSAVGLFLAIRQWDNVVAGLHNSVSWHGALGFAVALVLSKCWHELGHAFTAARHGVRVGHMGVALLVMLPMAYTDTGESWKLSRSGERLKIACAGIVAELILAGWATLLWSLAPEGPVKNAFFFLATTAWIMTVAVNASPFMRFDGYYILSDYLDFPGLHERAGNWAKRAMRRVLWGLDDPRPENLSPGFALFLTLFAFATWIYRLILFIGIAVVVYHAFFKALGVVLFLIEIITFVVQPMFRELKVCWSRRREMPRRHRMRLALVLAVVAVVVFTPWSGKVTLHGVLEAGVVQPVYTPFAARLSDVLVQEGQTVALNQPLFELDAPLPETSVHKASELREAWEANARGALGLDKDGPARQVMAEQMAREFAQQQNAGSGELKRLKLLAATSGVIEDVDRTVTPGSWIAPDTRIASVVNAHRWRVKALAGEEDLLRLHDGARVKVWLPGQWQPLTGEVTSIDNSAVTRLPSLLLAKDHGGPIALNPTHAKKDLRPEGVWYRVSIEGRTPEHGGVREGRVTVSIVSEKESLARRWLNSAMLTLIQQTGLGKEG
ncbi:HlyD family efflux transporter periplasmic adaptor subunit [Enterobacter hormaechei]|uniref:HlyD family efflux transporter periplasmic adaptor subunit n=1 Tax=Enterobacter cloacae complex TaxID=354276 RepID=UPI0007996624|nr:HlyD family efflux transporter periplasmic adaptor subunit [Enterobacter hormaechei]MDO2398890.1 HlyD family efflux transporter periplasmic adaptor subunit [Enterobacter hormaechei]MDO2404107.1 HlyD family efflux transporter periplasmic adaptor subunit [Enterobacter hormaechei]MDO2418626.1 HlyD family efflux transporter periplasmic adaptor subunit [Enterobacter hormaechei]MDO2426248.1 HlyD family efflux transporter periplasmic adaptor subunit [Enterobacter hormaechei]CZY22500.1 multidrug re